MNHELLAILEYIEQERGVSKEQLIQAIENALLTASRKSIHPASELSVKVDRQTGDIRAWATLEVTDGTPDNDHISLADARAKNPDVKVGDKIQLEVTPKDFGRIAAQTAKQAIAQQIRKAEKATVQEEFQDKIGEIVSGTVRRYEAGGILVDLGKAEGILSSKDRVPGEQYSAGDRINALLLKVDVMAAGPSLILSRTSPQFIQKLFEREVSEIHDGVVQIVGIAREAGSRTKVAVKSSDQRIDPVGACVGMRGMRVKNITGELGGERVDIIHYSENISEYTANALHPAKAEKIEVHEDTHLVVFYVNAENSRLAFGKKAQNVRLAQKLISPWKIDIKTAGGETKTKEEIFEEKKAQYARELSGLLGISEESSAKLVSAGFLSLDGLRAVSREDLAAIPGLPAEDVDAITEKIATGQPGA